MDLRPSGPTIDDLESFAAAVAHELRTPLSALSGEVELALRRERTQAAYREALSRIAISVGELIDLTGDLSFLGDSTRAQEIAGQIARLDLMLAHVAERYRATAPHVLHVERDVPEVSVSGDERLLTRALSLVVEHAVRHRRDGAQVRMRAASTDGPAVASGPVDLVVDADPLGFLPQAWQFLIAAAAEGAGDRRFRPGPLRLRTAERIVRDCGGSLHVTATHGTEAVRIRLRYAEAG